LFFMRVRTKGEGVFGFVAFGWTSRVIENPDSPPREWVAREASSGEGCLAGAGGVWKEEGFLYAMSPATDGSGMRLARWRVEQAEAGALSRPQWWTGAGWGEDGPAAALFRPAPTEASVLRDERGLTLVQTAEGGAIAIRRASRPEGPWSEPETMFTPPEASRPDTFAYAGKAHAQLGRVATYATNAWEPERLLEDRELYFPRFVRLPPLGGD